MRYASSGTTSCTKLLKFCRKWDQFLGSPSKGARLMRGNFNASLEDGWLHGLDQMASLIQLSGVRGAPGGKAEGFSSGRLCRSMANFTLGSGAAVPDQVRSP
jgi:hypothetical protein